MANVLLLLLLLLRRYRSCCYSRSCCYRSVKYETPAAVRKREKRVGKNQLRLRISSSSYRHRRSWSFWLATIHSIPSSYFSICSPFLRRSEAGQGRAVSISRHHPSFPAQILGHSLPATVQQSQEAPAPYSRDGSGSQNPSILRISISEFTKGLLSCDGGASVKST